MVELRKTQSVCLRIVYATKEKSTCDYSQVLEFHRGPSRA